MNYEGTVCIWSKNKLLSMPTKAKRLSNLFFRADIFGVSGGGKLGGWQAILIAPRAIQLCGSTTYTLMETCDVNISTCLKQTRPLVFFPLLKRQCNARPYDSQMTQTYLTTENAAEPMLGTGEEKTYKICSP